MKTKNELIQILNELRLSKEDKCITTENGQAILSLGVSEYNGVRSMYILVSTNDLEDMDYHYLDKTVLENEFNDENTESIYLIYKEFYGKYINLEDK